ncbi:MAG: TonB-dependent receptor [Saprospiraceae bacterium]|nr:TonB-dependent receptor [Saprospiraceae bacterium]MCF8251891.1 TonB-dependent receptor [Saprospiraceae bacterium]MCF8281616.1 TonB-dependent receptor [Bacteroidales bacterium]MCF8313593.1 TonB-dependent receptor [Saprospiraceae bacterium]MCF8442275.1 TonB-dependent receptor [Saprospiraceae bacterium]
MQKLLLAGIALLFSTFLFSQKITGKITDAEGVPLPSATVLLLETRQGAIADEQGNFELSPLKPGVYTLRVSFVGFEQVTQTVETPSLEPLKIALEPSANLLQTLTVTAVRAGGKSPFTYTNISGETLQTRNLGQDVPYLLDATPSVVATSDAGAGIGYTGIRIRGTDASRINVTINGVPLNDAESQGVFWVDLPDVAASTESIQIQRGVGTSTNGGGAFGASINLNTNELQAEPYAEVSGTAGSFNTQKVSLKLGSGLIGKDAKSLKTGFTVDARGSLVNSDGYIDRASSKLRSAYFSPAFIGKKFTLRGILLHGDERTYQAWYGLPAQYIGIDSLRTYNPAGTESGGKPYENQVDDYRQTHTQLIYNQELNRNWHFNLTGHYTRGIGFYEEYKANQHNSDYGWILPNGVNHLIHLIRRRWLDNHFFGGVGSANFTSNDKRMEATIGVAVNRYLGNHYGTVVDIIQTEYTFPPGHRYYDGVGEKTDASAFLKLQYGLTNRCNIFLDFQGRGVDYYATNDQPYVVNGPIYNIHTANYRFFNPKAGLFYEANKNTSLYASFAVAQKEPNRDDFTDAPRDRTPKPERLFNTEAGLNYKAEKGAFGLNFYHMYYRNQLVLTGNINDTGAPIRINVPSSYRMGVELTGKTWLSQHFVADANATFSRNKIKEFTEFVDNWDTGGQGARLQRSSSIALSPSVVAFGRLTWGASQSFVKDGLGLSIALAGKHVGKQFIDNTSNENTVLDAYATLEAQLRYVVRPNFCRELSFNLLVQNLLNARYSSNAWTYRFYAQSDFGQTSDPYVRRESGNYYNMTGYYPQAGRNFLLGVTVRF